MRSDSLASPDLGGIASTICPEYGYYQVCAQRMASSKLRRYLLVRNHHMSWWDFDGIFAQEYTRFTGLLVMCLTAPGTASAAIL